MDFCQATKSDPVKVELPSQSPDGPYRLCGAAAIRLQKLCLRPSEWFNLAALHGPFEYYLHDDFYDQDGTATQPHEDVVDPELFPAPVLEDVAGDLLLLLNYAGTRWRFEADLAGALRRQDPERMLSLIKERYLKTNNLWFRVRYNEICGFVLGRTAERWVRHILSSASPPDRVRILRDAGCCLPQDEALDMTLEALDSLSASELQNGAYFALAQFHHTKAVDWIEKHAPEQVVSQWGDLAALCGLTWQRAAAWLQRGRPLSLVALDALSACDNPRPNQSILVQRMMPRLLSPPPKAVIEAALLDYAKRDPAPRVKKSVNYLIGRLKIICE